MDILTIKKQIKDWENEFIDNNKRIPSKDDIKAVSSIKALYKLYFKLKKDTTLLARPSPKSKVSSRNRESDKVKKSNENSSKKTKLAKDTVEVTESSVLFSGALDESVLIPEKSQETSAASYDKKEIEMMNEKEFLKLKHKWLKNTAVSVLDNFTDALKVHNQLKDTFVLPHQFLMTSQTTVFENKSIDISKLAPPEDWECQFRPNPVVQDTPVEEELFKLQKTSKAPNNNRMKTTKNYCKLNLKNTKLRSSGTKSKTRSTRKTYQKRTKF